MHDIRNNNSDGKLKEYDTLRQEILNAKERISHIINLSIVATAAIFSLFGTFHDALSFHFLLVPLVIWFPAFFLVHYETIGIYRTGRYIEVFLEKEVEGLNWERRWMMFMGVGALGKIESKGLRRHITIAIIPLFFQILFMIIAISSAIYTMGWNFNYLYIYLPLMLMLFGECYYLAHSPSVDELRDRWVELRTIEHANINKSITSISRASRPAGARRAVVRKPKKCSTLFRKNS